VHVDESRGHDQPLGVDGALRLRLADAADGDDLVAANGDIAHEPGVARAVHDPAAPDEQVVSVIGRPDWGDAQ
jgi:hypothetical protein